MLYRLIVLTSIWLVLAAPVTAQESIVTLVTHDSFSVSEAVLQQFEAETGIRLEILRAGDAGVLVNQAILTKDNPLGDVLFGVDNTFLGRALAAEIFVPYESPLLVDLPDAFKLDPENRVTPIDFGDVCLNYDAAYFAETALPLPESLSDLTKPEYKGLLAVQNPATSSPGLAFLLTSIANFGDEGDYTYLDFWGELLANDVYISDDWTDSYYTQFSGSAGSTGIRPLVVSYASSPPAEVFFMETPPETAPTGSIVADMTCFRQIEFAGVLLGARNPEGAQQFIDFMLGESFQEDLPLQMFVFPVNPSAELPEVFAQYAVVAENPAVLDADLIDAKREEWIQAWSETVLR